MNAVDRLLLRIRAQMDLEADREREVLEEIRLHLEEALDAACCRGLSEPQAVAEVAKRFGVEEVGQALQETHVGWGTADGVIAAGLPVLCTVILRWLVFAPNGTAVGWEEILIRPAFWVVTLAALLIPLLKFPRWRYALVSWGFFWMLSVLFFSASALRW